MNLDDPKLTAYALGEITDPAEITEIETWLAINAEGRAYLVETQELATFLSENLHASSMGLTDEQRQQILAQDKVIPLPTARRNWSIVAMTALAACLAAAPLLPWAELLRLRDSSAPTVAFNDKPMTIQMPREEQEPLIATRPAAKKASDQVQMLSETASAPIADTASPMLLQKQPTIAAASPRQFRLEEKLKNEIGKSDSLIAGNSWERPIVANQIQPALTQAPVRQNAASVMSGSGGGVGKGKLARRDRFSDESRIASNLGMDKDAMPADDVPNTEAYDSITENDFLSAKENPLSTFSIDVDTASYANVRRFLNNGQLPPKGAVRIEELLNYFTYNYAPPTGDAPFSTNLEVADCPWQPDHRLVRIGLKGKEIPVADRKPANLVFLIDVSGSMDGPERLPLVKQSLRLLVDQLAEKDTISLAVYAGQSGLVLPATSNKAAIRAALENLQPGGSTNGASGIRLAYEEAEKHFIKDGINRVILATDGDFNVGVTSQSDLADLITEKAKSGVFLSVLGFGTGNVKDSTMEKLADKGNGNYAYIDSLREGKKVLVEQMGGTLITIAKDVKIQVEFNPGVVSSYRLIGYENRALKKEDFNDDNKDAGEIGSGHTVTALYEIVPANVGETISKVDALKYSSPKSEIRIAPVGKIGGAISSDSVQKSEISPEMLTVKLRYKEPSDNVSKLLEFPLTDKNQKLAAASSDFRFASAVAEFGQLLRQSSHSQLASWESLLARASEAKGEDKGGYRAAFVELVKKAQTLSHRDES